MSIKEQRIARSRFLLENPYAYLEPEGGFDAEIESVREKWAAQTRSARGWSKKEIANAVRDVHRMLWDEQNALEPAESLKPARFFDPQKTLEMLGYEIVVVPKISVPEAPREKIAGIIGGKERRVVLSDDLSEETKRFTAAHELAHAILHPGQGLHRDRPVTLDGTKRRSQTESEADYFAALFLMPRKLVLQHFVARFGVEKFVLTAESAHALASRGPNGSAATDLRELSKLLAATSVFDGNGFKPLCKEFGVSVVAMAITLEELQIVGPWSLSI
ncbi:MAG: ImmA/IrrE family metallo-endopeptidase [Pseudomonadota bacterium]